MTHSKPRGKNRGGRPPKERDVVKCKIITLKCTSYEKIDIQARAHELGLSVSEFMVKATLNRQIGSPKFNTGPIPRDILLELKGHLGPIGNNLNQLVKAWHNRTRIFTVAEKIEIMTACQLLKQILTRFENLLK